MDKQLLVAIITMIISLIVAIRMISMITITQPLPLSQMLFVFADHYTFHAAQHIPHPLHRTIHSYS